MPQNVLGLGFRAKVVAVTKNEVAGLTQIPDSETRP